jgi:YegS/Rv2252/BmrU family lipid kinase
LVSITPSISRSRRVFVVLNPVAGTSSAERVRRAINQHFDPRETRIEGAEGHCEIHETEHGVSCSDAVREAVGRGYDLVIAAGGDGTVSAVANGLVGTDTPLAILALGTANVLARELGIPLDLDAACRLAADPHASRNIDAMRVGANCYLTQLGVGLDAIMIRDTDREAKRRFGRIAYLWTATTNLLGFQPRRFTVTADNRVFHFRASQIVIANCGVLGQRPFRWGPDIHPDDGRLDVCIIRARSLWHYIQIAWHVLLGQHRQSPNVRYVSARHALAIASKRPLPVQADGEIIGETPVTVEVAPGVVRVVVPRLMSHPMDGVAASVPGEIGRSAERA